MANRVQWKLGITRSLGPGNFVCYIKYLVISVVNEQYKTKEISSLGPERAACYIIYFVISDLFIPSFHSIKKTFLKRGPGKRVVLPLTSNFNDVPATLKTLFNIVEAGFFSPLMSVLYNDVQNDL